MANKEKLRSEIENQYKWDLTPIYESEKEWNKDYLKAKEEIEKINDYKDSFLSSATCFLNFLKYYIIMQI